MRVLLIGSGGREHAVGLSLVTDPQVKLWSAPGNPGLAALGETLAVDITDHAAVVEAARHHQIDLVFVGPEAPLVAGLGDALARAQIACVGPTAAAARLEGSKAFTREVGAAVRVPSPRFVVVDHEAALNRALDHWNGPPPVVKADGLAGGKGVFLPDTREECTQVALELLGGSLGDAGRVVVLEERLTGVEASLFYACHDRAFIPLPHARDHKRLLDGDRGPNTGGMGAISPNPAITPELVTQVGETMVRPTLAYLSEAGSPFVGFLFVGVMLTDGGPKLLEYNVRLGDPETQAILPRLKDGELARLCRHLRNGHLEGFQLRVREEATCAVVLTAAGYPEVPRKGDLITIDPALSQPDRWLVHAGTRTTGKGIFTDGGRVATVVSRKKTLGRAIDDAYAGARLVSFAGKQMRTDIGVDHGKSRPS